MPPGGLDGIHHISPSCGISAGHYHACSLGGHGDRDPSPDVAGRSCYQGDLTLEACGHDISRPNRRATERPIPGPASNTAMVLDMRFPFNKLLSTVASESG